MSMAVLELSSLRKAYGALRVTDDVSLRVERGECLGIIGPNGAGKTTLVHQISGLARCDSGRILFEGEDVTGLPMSLRARRGLVRSFQITAVLPRMSALENVALAIQARRGSNFRFFVPAAWDRAINSEAMGLLERFGLDTRAHVTAGILSHGEKRQLELAIALGANPKLLLLDEPLAGTSHDEARRITELLSALKTEISIVLIEHDMDAVFALADRICVLVYGRVIANGTVDEIRASAEVRAAYLGEEAA